MISRNRGGFARCALRAAAPAMGLAGVWAASAAAGELALKRVMLSSAGVGYFEYAAEVDGPAELGLDVKLAQVDDVLKSLVVFDDAGGVGGLELPGRDQTHGAFGEVPFGPEGLGSPLAFLNSLQGVEITVEGPRPMRGRLMQAEAVQEAVGRPGADPPGATQARTRVSVLTEDGLKQFVLEESDAVQVADPGLRARIGAALAALKRDSGQESRHITIRTAGSGHRVIRVGYVAVAPLWKASYRMVLPAVGADAAHATARLQGWATLENDSGADWSGVALTLQYGNPVTFHQAIYQSYYVDRPEVPVQILGRLLPGIDLRAFAAQSQRRFGAASAPMQLAPPPQLAAPAPAPAPTADEIAPPAAAVEATEGAEETMFALPAPVSLAAGHSASVPILDRKLPAVRLDVAQQNETHPRAAIRLRNDTPQSLPAGVLTLFDDDADGPYVGDARLGGLPAGEGRLLEYAQDLRTSVDWTSRQARTLVSLKAYAGNLQITHRDREITRATVVAPVHEPRHVLLALPKEQGRAIADGFDKPAEETATEWRFALDLKAGETRTLRLATDTNVVDTIAFDQAGNLLAALGDAQTASEAVRSALAHVGVLRQQEMGSQAALDRLVAERDRVDADERRNRENLAATQPGDALHGRLMRQLDADETRYAKLADAIDAATAAAAGAHKAVTDAIGALDF